MNGFGNASLIKIVMFVGPTKYYMNEYRAARLLTETVDGRFGESDQFGASI